MKDFALVRITSTDEEPLFNKQDRIYMISKYIQGDTVTFAIQRLEKYLLLTMRYQKEYARC